MDCPICFESISIASGHLTTRCGHTFHPDCMLKWFKISKQCPICRNEWIHAADVAGEITAAGPPDAIGWEQRQPILSMFIHAPMIVQWMWISMGFLYVLYAIWIISREALLEKIIHEALMCIVIGYIFIVPTYCIVQSTDRVFMRYDLLVYLLGMYMGALNMCVLMEPETRARILNWHYVALSYPLKDTPLVVGIVTRIFKS